MMKSIWTFVASGFALFALAACGGETTAPSTPAISADVAALPQTTDMSLGQEDAPITLIEYAAWNCPACRQFHNTMMPMIKSEFIETGKVRVIYREFPIHPVPTSIAGFVVARCAGPDRYFDVIDELYDRQPGLMTIVRQGGPIGDALRVIASNHGIDTPEAFKDCLDNQEFRDQVKASYDAGRAKDVNATPTIFINGARIENQDRSSEFALREKLNQTLAELGIASDAAAPVETISSEQN